MRLPIDLAFGRPPHELPPPNTTTYVWNLQEELEEVHRYIWQHMVVKSDWMNFYHDNQYPDGAALREGMAVQPPKEEGIITKIRTHVAGTLCGNNDLVYCIRQGPNTKPKVVHRNRLWQYKGKEPPSWFKAATVTPDLVPDKVPLTHTSEDKSPVLRRSPRSSHPPSRYGS